REVRAVEQIEDLDAELQVLPADGGVLEDRQVDEAQIRSAQDVASRGPVLTGRWQDERVRIEPVPGRSDDGAAGVASGREVGFLRVRIAPQILRVIEADERRERHAAGVVPDGAYLPSVDELARAARH